MGDCRYSFPTLERTKQPEIYNDLIFIYVEASALSLRNLRGLYCGFQIKGKGKVIPLQARCGPEGG